MEQVAGALSGLELEGAEWYGALRLDADTCFTLTAGLSDVVLLSGRAPERLVGKPLVLLEEATPRTGAWVSIGFGELAESRQYPPEVVARLRPLEAGSGSRWGVAVTVHALWPQALPCPPLERLAGTSVLFAVRSDALSPALPQSVTFTVAPAEQRGRFVATFRAAAPSGLPADLARFPVSIRGGSFELTAHADGSLRSTFESPRPRLTASAIAERLAARIGDPPPGMDACVIA